MPEKTRDFIDGIGKLWEKYYIPWVWIYFLIANLSDFSGRWDVARKQRSGICILDPGFAVKFRIEVKKP